MGYDQDFRDIKAHRCASLSRIGSFPCHRRRILAKLSVAGGLMRDASNLSPVGESNEWLLYIAVPVYRRLFMNQAVLTCPEQSFPNGPIDPPNKPQQYEYDVLGNIRHNLVPEPTRKIQDEGFPCGPPDVAIKSELSHLQQLFSALSLHFIPIPSAVKSQGHLVNLSLHERELLPRRKVLPDCLLRGSAWKPRTCTYRAHALRGKVEDVATAYVSMGEKVRDGQSNARWRCGIVGSSPRRPLCRQDNVASGAGPCSSYLERQTLFRLKRNV